MTLSTSIFSISIRQSLESDADDQMYVFPIHNIRPFYIHIGGYHSQHHTRAFHGLRKIAVACTENRTRRPDALKSRSGNQHFQENVLKH
jgi:hypothetical protein